MKNFDYIEYFINIIKKEKEICINKSLARQSVEKTRWMTFDLWSAQRAPVVVTLRRFLARMF